MRAFFIYNPGAGMFTAEAEIADTIGYLRSENVDVLAVKATLGQGDATTYAREAVAQRCDVLFLCGGDGTIAQAAEGLIHADTALAILPGGSGNVLARQLNLPVAGPLHPRPLLESARALLGGKVRAVDVGRVTLRHGVHRHFVSWAGIGFDARVSRTVDADPIRKKQLGAVAFALAGFLSLRDFAGTAVRLRVDGHRINRRILMLVANNIQLYGIIFRMAQHAVMDDGCLDIYGFQGNSPARTLLHAVRLLFNRHIADPEVDIYRARRLEITSTKPMPIQIDGDYVGETPAIIEAVPRALQLLVPATAPATLFARAAGEVREPSVDWMHRVARDVQSVIRPEYH